VAKTNYRSVDEYIAAQPEAVRPTLARVRALIHEALPGAEERISYQLPAFRLHRSDVVYLNAASKHFALYPSTDGLVEALGEELAPHLHGKGTMRFLYADPVPTKLIERIVKFRAKEAEAAAKAKAAKKR
jgi:uncharacterized protein YdhG (YjbR/CyaY superfamily)